MGPMIGHSLIHDTYNFVWRFRFKSVTISIISRNSTFLNSIPRDVFLSWNAFDTDVINEKLLAPHLMAANNPILFGTNTYGSVFTEESTYLNISTVSAIMGNTLGDTKDPISIFGGLYVACMLFIQWSFVVVGYSMGFAPWIPSRNDTSNNTGLFIIDDAFFNVPI